MPPPRCYICGLHPTQGEWCVWLHQEGYVLRRPQWNKCVSTRVLFSNKVLCDICEGKLILDCKAMNVSSRHCSFPILEMWGSGHGSLLSGPWSLGYKQQHIVVEGSGCASVCWFWFFFLPYWPLFNNGSSKWYVLYMSYILTMVGQKKIIEMQVKNVHLLCMPSKNCILPHLKSNYCYFKINVILICYLYLSKCV